jgi:hypothetical protein
LSHRPSAACPENGTERCQSAQIGAKGPEKVPNCVPQAFPAEDNKRAAVLAALPKHLRTLAHAVRKLGNGYRTNPEKLAESKDEIAAALTSLAVLLEGSQ